MPLVKNVGTDMGRRAVDNNARVVSGRGTGSDAVEKK